MDTFERFNKILIVGVGLIGGSLALALKRKGYTGTIIGVDNPYALENAKKRKAVDLVYSIEELGEAASQADLIFLCTPINVIIEHLQVLGKYVKPNTLITDVGSIKRKIVETANIHLPQECDFIGGHPMAGSEFRGVNAADPFLFENTIYVLTPVRPINESTRKAFGDLLERIGAKVLLLLPKLHDEIAAAVSHLPQMAAVALMNMVANKQKESPHFLKMAAGGFRDMTRIASSPYGMWEQIRTTNADMIVTYIDAYIEELNKVKNMLLTDDLQKYFENSARNRLYIPSDTKGFLRPHYDISVAVEDRPGMIALITNTLAGKEINIKDIEVLKIREDEGGTIRLAFSTEKEQEMALELLKANGLECGKRE
ncbi:MAG TPA: prephenate dehydrogenase [bacterium]|nr:prephenate dehydrogenase [bacterium]HPN43297.1 prephenate dehydrogenase [bacterium]